MKELIEDYQSKMPVYVLQKKYKLSYKAINKLLLSSNVYVKNNSKVKNNTELEKFITDNYGILSNKEILETKNISFCFLKKILEKNSIALRGSGSKINIQLDNLNKKSNWFSYFLGWAASDGSVQNKKGNYTFSLKVKDEEIVDMFYTLIPRSKKYYHRDKDMYCLHIGNKQFVEYLVSIGITPRKSRTLEIKESELNNHFIRGLFDGDGSVRNTKLSQKHEAKITSGSLKFVKQLVNYLDNNGIKTSSYKNGDCVNVTTTSKTETKSFYLLMYKDCDNYFLKRKKDLFEAMFSNEQ